MCLCVCVCVCVCVFFCVCVCACLCIRVNLKRRKVSMIPRTLSHLPNDPKSWQWNHFMQAYYSSDYAARSRKHRMFGRFSYPHNARRLHNPPQRQQQPQHPQHQQHLDNKQVGNSWEFSPSSSSSSPFCTPSLMFDTQ